jgi:pectate lyase
MRKIALLVVALALVVTGLAVAQGKVDFSGKWAPKVDPNAAPPAGGGGGGGRGGGGGPMTVKQTATELTQERTMGENTMTTVFKLDGTESVNKTQRGESKSTAKFDGAKLVIKTVSEGANGPQETTATWSLSADGKELTVVNVTARGERIVVYTKQ